MAPLPLVELMTVGEVAEALAVSVSTVWRLIRRGELRHVRPRPTLVRIRRADLEAFMEARGG